MNVYAGLLSLALLLTIVSMGQSKGASRQSGSAGDDSLDAVTQDKIKSGFVGTQELLDGMSKLGPEKVGRVKNFFGKLEKLGAFAGAAGGLISLILIFLPTRDSAELRYMKKQFSQVNEKLDAITGDLDAIKDLITLEAQRAAYISAENRINYGFDRMYAFLDRALDLACTDKTDCYRKRVKLAEKYIKDLDVANDLYAIIRGTIKSDTFGDSLLDSIKKSFKCDLGKIDQFMNGVKKLSFKGIQVITAHGQLTGTKTATLAGLKKWFESLNDLRRKGEEVISGCFKYLDYYIREDVGESKHLTPSSPRASAVSLWNDLSRKYAWLNWIVFSYTVSDENKHAGIGGKGIFWNAKGGDQKDRRYIVAVPQGKGDYFGRKKQFTKAFKEVYESFIVLPSIRSDNLNAVQLHKRFETRLKIHDVWHLLKSFTVLTGANDLGHAVSTNQSLHAHWYKESIKVTYVRFTFVIPWFGSQELDVIAVFKSNQELESNDCQKNCSGHGKCRMWPHAGASFCQCEDNYLGENCEDRMRTQLAVDLERMLDITFQVPTLSDVHFQIQDLSLYLSLSIDNVLEAAFTLRNEIQESFVKMNAKIGEKFRWANLLTVYSDTITHLTFNIRNVPSLEAYEHKNCVSDYVTRLDRNVVKWLDDLNHLILGRPDVLVGHKPILFLLMHKHISDVCTPEYKNALDNSWKQLVMLQYQANMLLIQLREVQGKSSSKVLEAYKTRLNKQTKYLDANTCRFSILDSTNVKCSGPKGTYYVYAGMTIQTSCRHFFFVSGNLLATCPDNKSICKPCYCDPTGSTGGECADLSGSCSCKEHFKGQKCKDRDCGISSWLSWANCPACGHGTETRTRYVVRTRMGSGKPCSGSNTQQRPCFKTCCQGSFLCGQSCAPIHKRCNYIDDHCGDEANCVDDCQAKNTPLDFYNYDETSNGNGELIYLDRHKLDCAGPHNSNVMQKFRLIWDRNRIKYEYKCCRLAVDDMCTKVSLKTTLNDDGHTDSFKVIYLDRHSVDCGQNGLLNDFRLTREGESVRYVYGCCRLKSSYHGQVKCYDAKTVEQSGNDGDVRFLTYQTVICREKYYLKSFQLQAKMDSKKHMWYKYTCCTIQTKT